MSMQSEHPARGRTKKWLYEHVSMFRSLPGRWPNHLTHDAMHRELKTIWDRDQERWTLIWHSPLKDSQFLPHQIIYTQKSFGREHPFNHSTGDSIKVHGMNKPVYSCASCTKYQSTSLPGEVLTWKLCAVGLAKDYYEILGVPKDASQDDIKKAFLTVSNIAHGFMHFIHK